MNIETVARASGFSKATVSRVMRNDSRVAPRTRETIRSLAESMGYRPNPLVTAHMRNVRLNRRLDCEQTVGLLRFPGERSKGGACPFERELVHGLRERAAETGFRIDELVLPPSASNTRRLNEVLLARGLQGVILGPMLHRSLELELDWQRYSMVAVSPAPSCPRLHNVRPDSFQNLHTVMERLIGQGYQRIGLVVDNASTPGARDLWLGSYLCHSAGAPDLCGIPPLLLPGSVGEARSSSFSSILRNYIDTHGLEAVIGRHELLEALGMAGIGVPGHCAFAGLDMQDEDSGGAGIDERYREIGARVMDLLSELLYRNERGIPARPQTILIGGEWRSGWTAPDMKVAAEAVLGG